MLDNLARLGVVLDAVRCGGQPKLGIDGCGHRACSGGGWAVLWAGLQGQPLVYVGQAQRLQLASAPRAHFAAAAAVAEWRLIECLFARPAPAAVKLKSWGLSWGLTSCGPCGILIVQRDCPLVSGFCIWLVWSPQVYHRRGVFSTPATAKKSRCGLAFLAYLTREILLIVSSSFRAMSIFAALRGGFFAPCGALRR